VGLENVRRRLEALYGSEARLTVHAETEAFGVGLSLPARRS
jgi:LytS/YehU family sensor histidine kinase